MEMLHTPEELVRLSNMAHIAEAIVLFIIAALLFAQAFGYLRTGWKRYLWPSVGLLASLILAYALLVGHYNELGKAWRVITTDMQQKQHFQIGVLIGIGAIAELFATRLKKKWLHLVFPITTGIIGVLFLTHPQHGTAEQAQRGLMLHRIAGSALVVAALSQAGAVLRAKSQKVLLVITAFALAISAGAFAMYREPLMDMAGKEGSGPIQSHRTYSLKPLTRSDYQPNKPAEYSFQIVDERGQVLKDFDVVHEKQMHFITIRKDATNYQHLHPEFDSDSGTFRLTSLTFPADGEYRLFADFTPSDAQMGPEGTKLPATPYIDTKVGDMSKYKPQPLGEQRFDSNTNGFDINVFLAPHGPNDLGLVAGTSSSFAVSVHKNKEPYAKLEPYLGARGHMVVFGPDLEFIHGHTTNDSTTESYIITFSVNFPKGGKYKAFLQTQTEGKVNTTDYVLEVSDAIKDNTPTPDPAHRGH